MIQAERNTVEESAAQQKQLGRKQKKAQMALKTEQEHQDLYL